MENLSATTDLSAWLEPRSWLNRESASNPSGLRSASGEGRRAPGWFDSSWELRRGLEVREGLPEGIDFEQWLEVPPGD